MKKNIIITILFIMCLLMTGCNTANQASLPPTKAVYMIEDKPKVNSIMGNSYSIRISEINKPNRMHSISVGKTTWKTLKEGDYLDYNYKVVK